MRNNRDIFDHPGLYSEEELSNEITDLKQFLWWLSYYERILGCGVNTGLVEHYVEKLTEVRDVKS